MSGRIAALVTALASCTPFGTEPSGNAAAMPTDAGSSSDATTEQDGASVGGRCSGVRPPDFCDDFDHGEGLSAWTVTGNARVDAVETYSSVGALAIDAESNSQEAFIEKRFPHRSRTKVELRLALSTSDTTGEVDVIAIHLQGLSQREYAVNLIRAQGRWQIERGDTASSNRFKTADVKRSPGQWSLVELEIAGTQAIARVDGVVSTLDISDRPSSWTGVSVAIGLPFMSGNTAAGYHVRVDDVVITGE